MFSQLDSSNSRRYQGNGIGLALCEKLLQLQGGKIWVESDGKTGSSFYVNIPFTVAKLPSIKSNLLSLVGKKVLLWISFHENLNILTKFLKTANVEVNIVNNKEQIESQLKLNTFNWIVIDHQVMEIV